MLRTLYIFFVCKTLYKWILINFCFNTWSPFRLSCNEFQGVCCPKVFPMWPWKERRCYSQTYGTWKLSRSGVCSVDAAPQLSESWCGSHFLLLVICLTERMLGNCDSLSCLDGCIMGVCVCLSFPPFPLQDAPRADSCDIRILSWLPAPALSWLFWMHGIWANPSVLSQSQELTSERHGVVMHDKQLSHIWNISKLHL